MAIPASLPAEVLHPSGLLRLLLDTSPTGIMLLQPRYDTDGSTISDFDWVSLNPAAQQQLGLPAHPSGSFRTHYPTAEPAGVFAFYCEAFHAGELARRQNLYQADGLDGYFVLVAQRYESLLVVHFTDTNNQPRTAVEAALRASQAREQQARAEAETQRQRFYDVLQQLPAQVATYHGPDYRFAFVNSRFQAFVPTQELLGRPLREASAGAVDEEVFALLDRVYATGEVVQAQEVAVHLPAPAGGESQSVFVNASYHPLRDAAGHIYGVLDFSYDVTEQVLARRQVEQLNQELETRVVARTQELANQRQQLGQILAQVPAAIATLEGPEHRFAFANAQYRAIVGNRATLDQPAAEAQPELVDQGFIALLDQVYATGAPYLGREIPVRLHDANGEAEVHYVDFSYQPLRDEQGRTTGILTFAVDETEKVLARRQTETLQAALLAVAQRRAQERQDLYQIFAQTPAAIVLLREPDHRIDYFNPAFEALFPPEEWQGPLQDHTIGEVYPRVKLAGLVELLDAVFRTGESQVVTEMPLADLQPGSPRYVTFSYQAYREQGRIAGVAAFVYDVTEQVLARRHTEQLQAELLASAQRRAQEREDLFQIFEQAPAAIMLLREPQHRIEYVNPAYQQFFPGQPLQGRSLAEVHPQAAASGVLARLDRVYETGEAYVGQEEPVSLVLTPGQPAQTRYFTFTYQPYRENGRTVGVSIFATDATEQALARQQRDAQAQELRRVFEQAPVAITIMRGPELELELVNASMRGIWGRSAAQVLGQPYFTAVPDTGGQGFEESFGAVLTTGQPFAISEAPVHLDRAHTGLPEVGYFNFIFHPLFDAQQQATGLIAVGTEVTEQVLGRQQVQQLNQELQATNQQLTRTNADLDTFVYAASHDLKSPIANIEGLVEALRDYLPADHPEPMVPRLLGMIDGAVRRFQQTVGHLTDISRLQHAAEQAPAAVDLTDLIDDVRLDLAPLLESTRAQLLVDVANCPPVRFSAKNLRAIVFNLLSNAVKYRAPDRAPVVQLRATQAAGQVVLDVQDNGLGLSADQQRQLFAMFRRLHDHVEGSGVGLYLLKRIVENAGGTISVASEAGVGSTFTVRIPNP